MMYATLSSRFMSEQTMLRSIMSPTSKTEELVSSHNIKVGNTTSYAHCYELVMWALQPFISSFCMIKVCCSALTCKDGMAGLSLWSCVCRVSHPPRLQRRGDSSSSVMTAALCDGPGTNMSSCIMSRYAACYTTTLACASFWSLSLTCD